LYRTSHSKPQWHNRFRNLGCCAATSLEILARTTSYPQRQVSNDHLYVLPNTAHARWTNALVLQYNSDTLTRSICKQSTHTLRKQVPKRQSSLFCSGNSQKNTSIRTAPRSRIRRRERTTVVSCFSKHAGVLGFVCIDEVPCRWKNMLLEILRQCNGIDVVVELQVLMCQALWS
jgi:hypothetical protein